VGCNNQSASCEDQDEITGRPTRRGMAEDDRAQSAGAEVKCRCETREQG